MDNSTNPPKVLFANQAPAIRTDTVRFEPSMGGESPDGAFDVVEGAVPATTNKDDAAARFRARIGNRVQAIPELRTDALRFVPSAGDSVPDGVFTMTKDAVPDSSTPAPSSSQLGDGMAASDLGTSRTFTLDDIMGSSLATPGFFGGIGKDLSAGCLLTADDESDNEPISGSPPAPMVAGNNRVSTPPPNIRRSIRFIDIPPVRSPRDRTRESLSRSRITHPVPILRATSASPELFPISFSPPGCSSSAPSTPPRRGQSDISSSPPGLTPHKPASSVSSTEYSPYRPPPGDDGGGPFSQGSPLAGGAKPLALHPIHRINQFGIALSPFPKAATILQPLLAFSPPRAGSDSPTLGGFSHHSAPSRSFTDPGISILYGHDDPWAAATTAAAPRTFNDPGVSILYGHDDPWATTASSSSAPAATPAIFHLFFPGLHPAAASSRFTPSFYAHAPHPRFTPAPHAFQPPPNAFNFTTSHPPPPLPAGPFAFPRRPIPPAGTQPGGITLAVRAASLASSSELSGSGPPPPPRARPLVGPARAAGDAVDDRDWECCNCAAINSRWEFVCSRCQAHTRRDGAARCCLMRGEEGWVGDGVGDFADERGDEEVVVARVHQGNVEGEWIGRGGRR
ncbi:hypothetical protein QBC39DRAFT_366615 [Podospora conica]|nr:hypothetical protein QBC39DRAFT_366615 [Schizothecium conicum]